MAEPFGTVGNGREMAGNLESTAEAAAAVAAGVAAAVAAQPGSQAAAAEFISEYGAAVLDGHGEVKGPATGVTVEYD